MIHNENQDEIQGFLKDASNMQGGKAESVWFPESEEDVVELLRECYEQRTPVTVAGAGTGLAGGRVPFGGRVISMSRMNRIITIDPDSLCAVVEPGVVLGDFQREVEHLGCLYPPDPTERNCFVGATVATNSSGARTFKYGPTRNYVTGLRIVLATGEIVALKRGQVTATDRQLEFRTVSGRLIELTLPDITMPSTKHAAGYYIKPGMDAIDLFIGSEGTLGVITEITVRLLPLPQNLFSGIVFFPDEESMMAFVDDVRQSSQSNRAEKGDDSALIDARALEFIDKNALDFIRDSFPSIPAAADGGAIWFEQEVTESTEEQIIGEWYNVLSRHQALLDDSWFGVGLEDQRRMREFRHAVPSAVYEYITEHGQTKLGTDMAVPDSQLRTLMHFYRQEFEKSGIRNITYGHIGNSHLHANMFVNGTEEYVKARDIYHRFILKALELGGTVSAEHGIGKLKTEYLLDMYGPEEVSDMKTLKRTLDPHMILGQGTLFGIA